MRTLRWFAATCRCSPWICGSTPTISITRTRKGCTWISYWRTSPTGRLPRADCAAWWARPGRPSTLHGRDCGGRGRPGQPTEGQERRRAAWRIRLFQKTEERTDVAELQRLQDVNGVHPLPCGTVECAPPNHAVLSSCCSGRSRCGV